MAVSTLIIDADGHIEEDLAELEQKLFSSNALGLYGPRLEAVAARVAG